MEGMQTVGTPENHLVETAKRIIEAHSATIKASEMNLGAGQIINVEELLSRSGSSARRALRILNAFNEAYVGLLGLLQAGREAKSPEALRRAAHALKGTLLDIGADGVAAVAAKVEHYGTEGDLDGALSLTQPLEHGTEVVASIVKEILSTNAA